MSAPGADGADANGWLPIESAPKDGSFFWGICRNAYSPAPQICWQGAEGWMLWSTGEKFVAPGPHRWFPTHWQPAKPPVA